MKPAFWPLAAAALILLSLPACQPSRKEKPADQGSARGAGTGPAPASPSVGGPAAADSANARARELTRTALVLAGMKEEAYKAGARLPVSELWWSYGRELDENWKRLERGQLAKLRKWADRELKPPKPQSPVIYYPFGGPDFLYAFLLFPRTDVYVLTGIEPVGDIVPTDGLPDSRIDALVTMAAVQLRDIGGLTFFRTNDLKQAQDDLGTACLLLIFLARTGHEILDATPFILDRAGKPQDVAPGPSGKTNAPPGVPGIRIVFRRKGEPGQRTLFYFAQDLSNAGLARQPGYLEFIRGWPRPITFLKATSYLLQYKTFSAVRRFILDRSLAVLQDDSGIAVKNYDLSRWDLTFYGHYVGPIDMFADFFQDELKDAYLLPAVKPLDFGIGYRFKPNESCLILAVEKNPGRSSASRGPARLARVTVGGVEARNVLVPNARPEIGLEFAEAVNPDAVRISLKDEKTSRAVALSLKWEEGNSRATAVPAAALEGRKSYLIVLEPAAGDREGMPPEGNGEWSFHVLGSPVAPLGDQTIVVDRASQRVFLCGEHGAILKTYSCATGSYYPTVGVFQVSEKIPSAKSLFDDSRFSFFTVFQLAEKWAKVGFHSIPVFPDGRPAGGLGQPNSHGCVRLAYEDAKFLYEWARLGTKVIVD
ncbi:MAG: L,D-transpeptidase family protein [Candidatus Aminicenantales bacterium]